MSKRTKLSPVHVCSLSMSALTQIERQLKEKRAEYNSKSFEERTQDTQLNNELNQLEWIRLSMQYNRQTQLQYVLQHLGDKGTNPKFRQAQMRPIFSAWKREILRQRWREVNDILTDKDFGVNLEKRFEQFTSQRTQLSARSAKTLLKPTNEPLLGLIAIEDDFENIFGFQTKEAQTAEFNSANLDFLASSAVRTFSTLPTEETLNTDEGPSDDLKAKLRARGIILDDDEPTGKLLSASERVARQVKKDDIQKKSNTLKFAIMFVCVLILIILIGIFISKRNAAEALRIQQEQCYSDELYTQTPTPKPTPRASRFRSKPTPTPTPTPKKGWFW